MPVTTARPPGPGPVSRRTTRAPAAMGTSATTMPAGQGTPVVGSRRHESSPPGPPRSFVLIGRPFAGPGKRTQLFCYLPKAALPDPAELGRLRTLLAHTLPDGVRPR